MAIPARIAAPLGSTRWTRREQANGKARALLSSRSGADLTLKYTGRLEAANFRRGVLLCDFRGIARQGARLRYCPFENRERGGPACLFARERCAKELDQTGSSWRSLCAVQPR
jgi:hypothetical protein